MRFTCEKNLLGAAIGTASRAAASKSAIPALEGLLLEAGHEVKLTGYDLKKGVYTTLEADVSEPGSVVLGARLFGEIVRKLPDGVVSVRTDTNGMTVIRCGNAEFSIMGSAAEDYPELPAMDYESSVSLGQDVLSHMIQETNFAVSDNESRPVYTGSLFEIENDELTLVAVDGYRLALRREAIDRCDVESSRFIVPGAALSDLEKICSDPQEAVKITLGSKHVSFSVGSTVLISRRLEGEFLNYKKTLPTEFSVRLTAERADLIRCADRVSLVIDDRTKNPLRCVFGDGELRISCTTPLGRAEDSCTLEGDGGGMEIGFNNRYLLEALKAAPAERLRINLNSGTAPCVILPEEGGDGFLYMILPVRLHPGER
jgi:DNA polymerase-3 subunit beta